MEPRPVGAVVSAPEAGVPTLSLVGLGELLRALEEELVTYGGLAQLWANKLRRELEEGSHHGS